MNIEKSFEHYKFDFENSDSELARKQKIEDDSIERHCQLDAERIFQEQLEYSDSNKEMNKYFMKDEYDLRKIYGGMIISNPPLFIHVYSESKWDSISIHDRTMELLKQKIDKYEQNVI